MDDPQIGSRAHRRALAGLARINRVSSSARVLLDAIRAESDLPRDRPLRLLDVACGGGDVLVELAALAHEAGLELELAACDVSPRALRYAAARARRARKDIRFFQFDAVGSALPEDYDIITATLFLHHLPREAAVALLRNLRDRARLIVIDDLRRTRLGFLIAWCGTRLLSRSPIVHIDGPRSVRAAFSKDELNALAREAGLARCRIDTHWPQRMTLSWNAVHAAL